MSKVLQIVNGKKSISIEFGEEKFKIIGPSNILCFLLDSFEEMHKFSKWEQVEIERKYSSLKEISFTTYGLFKKNVTMGIELNEKMVMGYSAFIDIGNKKNVPINQIIKNFSEQNPNIIIKNYM